MVIATLPTPNLADEYVRWLEGGHVDAVINGGAHSAMIVRLEPDRPGESPRVMTQYIFATRESFDQYVERHAPALRADGVRQFPPERGITMQRFVGRIA